MAFARRQRRIRYPGGLAAWLAILALLFQALGPAAAMAASAAGATEVAICTVSDAKTIVLGRDGAPLEPYAGLPCLGCLAATTATLVPPSLVLEPARYAEPQAYFARGSAAPPPRARAPPRPPGQGPPLRQS